MVMVKAEKKKEQKIEKKYKKFGESENGNFRIIDSIGVPHPYCITPNHLLPDRMYIDIAEAEKQGAVCDICKHRVKAKKQERILTHEEHEKALLVECKEEIKESKELHKYLLKIKKLAEKKGYAGFAFLDKIDKKW